MPTRTVCIAGAFIDEDSYANSRWICRLLEIDSATTVVDHSYRVANARLPSGSRRFFRGGWLIVRLIALNVLSLAQVLARRKRFSVVFVPYPSLPFMLLYSFIKPPQHRVIVDYFISLYDTVVNDRRLLAESSPWARLLFSMEKRSLRASDVVLTDTCCNSRHYAQLFQLESDKFKSIPLMINEVDFSIGADPASQSGTRVLFFGSLSPLQGIEKIIAAAETLQGEQNITLTIIGTGQCQQLVAEAAEHLSNLTWVSSWLATTALQAHIEATDICLGIFGDTDKAARVWPFKNYIAMHCAKPIINGSRFCLPAGADPQSLTASILTADSATELADRIRRLAANPVERQQAGMAARRYYDDYLSNHHGFKQLSQAIDKLQSG